MPLFFILSGICYTFPSKNIYLKNNIKKILKPYCLYALIGFFIEFLLHRVKGFEIDKTFYSFVKLLVGVSFWNYPLWFLVCFFVSKTIFDIIMLFSLKMKNFILVQFTCVMGVFFWGVLLGKFANNYSFFYPFRLDIGLTMIIFIFIGNLSKNIVKGTKNINRKKIIIILVILLSINLIAYKFNTLVSVNSSDYGNIFLFLISAVSGSYFVIIFCKILSESSISIKNKNFLLMRTWNLLGKQSLFILGTHAIILSFIAKGLIVLNYILKFSVITIDYFKFILCLLILIIICYYLDNNRKE